MASWEVDYAIREVRIYDIWLPGCTWQEAYGGTLLVEAWDNDWNRYPTDAPPIILGRMGVGPLSGGHDRLFRYVWSLPIYQWGLLHSLALPAPIYPGGGGPHALALQYRPRGAGYNLYVRVNTNT